MIKHFSYLIRSGLGIPDYWHPHLEIQNDFASGKIGRYPISMDIKGKFCGTLNLEGVPAVTRGNQLITTPVMVALYGLGSNDLFLSTMDERYLQQLRLVLSWLDRHRAPLGNGIGWPHTVNMDHLKAPWFSGLSQGLALSLLVRAYKIEQAECWRQLAFQTLLGFQVSVIEGGFSRSVKEGLIYEEYPTFELDCVFNGMCAALIGLWEAWSSGLVLEAEPYFREGVKALGSYLPRFDYDGWSLYSLNQCLGKPFIASPYYQRANGLMAQIIGLMADEPQFTEYGRRWISNSRSLMRRCKISLRIALDRAQSGLFTPEVKLEN